MALVQGIEWDVQTIGSDTNGGGYFYTAGWGQFDRSISGTPWLTIDNVTVVATVATTTITFTSGYSPSGYADMGNVVNIISGSGLTPGRYLITSCTSTTWTLDRSAGTSGTITSAKMGGSLLTIQAALTACTIADMAVHVKYGTYNITAALTVPNVAVVYQYCVLEGYYATHGDSPTGANRPTITTSNAVNGLTIGYATNWKVLNFILANTGSGLIGVAATFSATAYDSLTTINCLFTGWKTAGVSSSGAALLSVNCEFSGCVTTNGAVYNSSSYGTVLLNCYFHGNTGPCATTGSNGVVRNCVFSSVSSSMLRAYAGMVIDHCVFYCSSYGASSGILYPQNSDPGVMTNNIFMGCLYAVSVSTGAFVHVPYGIHGNNAYYYNSVVGNNYTAMPSDITSLGSSPFVSESTGDFRLNNTPNAGALLRAAGWPTAFAGLTPANCQDIGAYQHQDMSSISVESHNVMVRDGIGIAAY